MKNMETLNTLFNIEPLKTDDIILPVQDRVSEKENDYQLARDTLRNLIVKGESTLDEMIHLARNSEHPRSFEVAGQLIKTVSDVAKDLLALQKQLKDIEQIDKKSAINSQTNNVFVGSTEELLKLLKKDDGKIINNE